MLQTDMEKLIRAGKNLSGKTWEDVAKEIGVPASNILRTIKGQQITDRYIRIAEALGYDLRVQLMIRGEEDAEIH